MSEQSLIFVCGGPLPSLENILQREAGGIDCAEFLIHSFAQDLDVLHAVIEILIIEKVEKVPSTASFPPPAAYRHIRICCVHMNLAVSLAQQRGGDAQGPNEMYKMASTFCC